MSSINTLIKFSLILTIAFFFFSCDNQQEQKIELIETSNEPKEALYRTGDIIFQHCSSQANIAIQKATNSKYSHCGIIIIDENGIPLVAEAGDVVRVQPLMNFINQGENNEFVVKRLIDEIKINETDKLVNYLRSIENRNYDYIFDWSDDEIYCSELVWKAYNKAYEIEICDLRELREFDLTSEMVKKVLNEKYKDNIPLDESVVSPEDIFVSKLLKQVYPN
jgi:uncharacterized protein YycO